MYRIWYIGILIRSPHKVPRLCGEKEEQRNERVLPISAGRGIWSLRRRAGFGEGYSPTRFRAVKFVLQAKFGTAVESCSLLPVNFPFIVSDFSYISACKNTRTTSDLKSVQVIIIPPFRHVKNEEGWFIRHISALTDFAKSSIMLYFMK